MNTIRVKLAIGLMACFAALLAAGGYGVFYTAKKSAFDRIDQNLNVDAYSIMSATYLKEDAKVELHFTVSLLREYSGEVRTAFYQIWDQHGETLKQSESLRDNSLPLPQLNSRKAEFRTIKLTNGRLCRAMSISYGPKERGKDRAKEGSQLSLNLVVAEVIENDMASLAALRNSLLGVAALIVTITPILVITVLKRGLFPLADLAQKTESIDSDSLTQRFPVDSLPGELKPIATQLNQLLDRLHFSFERERTFSADVAHELRTPIAELRNMAEVGLKWKDPESAEDYQAALDIATQMQRIVNQLFDLMRCESNLIEISKEKIPLLELVDRLWKPIVPQAEQKNLSVNLSVPADVETESDPDMLARVVNNLLENAVAYSPNSGHVSIVFDPKNGALQIANTSRDLRAEELKLIFNRFWRKDKARADGSHSGIGLSIALAFAERLGLELDARLETDDRIVFTLSGLSREDELPNTPSLKGC